MGSPRLFGLKSCAQSSTGSWILFAPSARIAAPASATHTGSIALSRSSRVNNARLSDATHVELRVMPEVARIAQLAAVNGNGAPLVGMSSNGQGAGDPLAELSGLLALPSVGLRVTGADMFGRGSNAIARLHLSDGSRVELDPLGKFGNPSKLTIELAIQVGATPTLKAPTVARVMALLHKVAQHHETMTKAAIVADWGTDYLQSATTHAVDMADQHDRWRAFLLLRDTDPVARSRADGTSIASQSIVLEDRGRVRYVRCGWFLSYVRATSGPYSSEDLARNMQSVGWNRPGGQGRVKATRPKSSDTLLWTFYAVPKDWGPDA